MCLFFVFIRLFVLCFHPFVLFVYKIVAKRLSNGTAPYNGNQSFDFGINPRSFGEASK